MVHPDTLLQIRIADEPSPNGNKAFEPKGLEMTKSLRTDRAVGKLIGGQRYVGAAVDRCDINLAYHRHSFHRRAQGGEQQTVVTARVHEAHRARGESADAVGDQPFVLSNTGDSPQMAPTEVRWAIVPRGRVAAAGLVPAHAPLYIGDRRNRAHYNVENQRRRHELLSWKDLGCDGERDARMSRRCSREHP